MGSRNLIVTESGGVSSSSASSNSTSFVPTKQQLNLLRKTNLRDSRARWLPKYGKTTTRILRPSSTSRSTWSSTPAMSISPWHEADGVPDQPWGSLQVSGHCQADDHGVGHSSPGYGGRPRARENGEPEPVGPAQQGGGQGRRPPLRLPGGQLPQRAGGRHQGDRRHDHQDQAGRRRSRPPHDRQRDAGLEPSWRTSCPAFSHKQGILLAACVL